jgi:2'-5' RNA ligase
VLWIGLEAGKETLELLARSLDEALRREGFGPPDRPFQAHLTLGRVRDPGGEAGAAAAARLTGERAAGRWTVDRLTVVHSTLDPRGSIYRPVGEYALPGS